MIRLKDLKFVLPCFLLYPLFALWGQTKEVPPTPVTFEKIRLLDKYVSEGASIGDMDMDGYMDIVAGPLWWKGPDFKESYAYAPVKYFPIIGPGAEGYSTNFFTFPAHIDGNGETDILQIGLPGTDSKWIKDPGKTSYPLTDMVPEPRYLNALVNVCHESPVFMNVIGNGEKQLLAFSEGRLVLGVPSKKNGGDWLTFPISEVDPERFPVFSHGLGAGDINGDGLTDVLEKSGWWEQPKNWDRSTLWKYHQYPFSPGTGGAQMYAYDIDGDGLNDVVTSMNGHGYGLSWYEQIKEDPEIRFREHIIMTDRPEDSPYGVTFSQLHALAIADLDSDGVPDIATGKCFYAHNGHDPGAEDPAVLYWFKTTRHPDGSVEFIPYKIDDDSGVGRQISTGDLNKDGRIDIVTANKKGVFLFIQK